jgi:hypothetical protein
MGVKLQTTKMTSSFVWDWRRKLNVLLSAS